MLSLLFYLYQSHPCFQEFWTTLPVSGGWCSLAARDLLCVTVFLDFPGFSFIPFSVLSGTFGTLKKVSNASFTCSIFLCTKFAISGNHYPECQCRSIDVAVKSTIKREAYSIFVLITEKIQAIQCCLEEKRWHMRSLLLGSITPKKSLGK